MTSNHDVAVIILAAGRGTRMRSSLPKVMHPVGGLPLIEHTIKKALALSPQQVYVVYHPEHQQLPQTFAHLQDLTWVEQPEARGTGEAVQRVLPYLQSGQQCLILCADVPLLCTQVLKDLLVQAKAAAGLVTTVMPDPGCLGRIKRDAAGQIAAIVEAKDATADELAIGEINTGIMCFPADWLKTAVPQLRCDNQQKEYYLTDCIALWLASGGLLANIMATDWSDFLGVNNQHDLAVVSRIYQRRIAEKLMDQGVRIMDPDRFDCRGQIEAEADVVIDVNVVFQGHVVLGRGAHIAAHCVLDSVVVGAEAVIHPHSVLKDVRVDAGASVGPFAYLRPGTHLAEKSKVGAFVEMKKAYLGVGSKANHLSYLGDVVIGAGVNLGAGTITCNYDGQVKHQTRIGDYVFVGAGSQLIAPLTIAPGAVIAAGSCVVRPIEQAQLVCTYLDASGKRHQVMRDRPQRFVDRIDALMTEA